MFFTKNGTHLGIAFRDLTGSLYPSVGMRTPGEEIEVNFGHKPFEFDVASFIQETKEQVLASIQNVKLNTLGLAASGFVSMSAALSKAEGSGAGSAAATASAAGTAGGAAAEGSSSKGKGAAKGASAPSGLDGGAGGATSVSSSVLNKLVLSYLVHYGYSESVASFAHDTGETVVPDEVILMRKQIRNVLLEGDVEAAVRLTEQHFPSLFSPLTDRTRDLMFKLKCQKFIELVRRRSVATGGGLGVSGGGDGNANDESGTGGLEELVAFGCTLQQECDTENISAENRRFLKDAFSLVAYPDVSQSPVAYLMEYRQREEVAAALNSAILAHQNVPEQAPLETIAQAVQVAIQELSAFNGAATFVSLDDCFV